MGELTPDTHTIMHRTIFLTPVISSLFRLFSVLFFKLAGWKTLGTLQPQAHKSVFIAAPHTSNWDLPYSLMFGFVMHLNMVWMGKASLFKPPFGSLMRWLGGIPVDRSKSSNLVAASAQAIVQAKGALQLVLSPEGTRSNIREWKTGFYHIAVAAQVPIVMAYIDYQHKTIGLGPLLFPSGNIDADMRTIKAFYAPLEEQKIKLG